MIAIDVSVVIPCRNQARFLVDAVRSVEAGSLATETIVVDDGSSDGTSGVASWLSVTCIRQDHRGLAAARNTGLHASMGRFIVFLDADDHLLPGALETGAAALESHHDCAFAYGRCVMIGLDGEPWPTLREPRVERDHHAALLRRNVIWMPATVMFRREPLVAAGGFAEDGIDASADYDLYLRLSRVHPVFDHGALVAAYRRHGANMSGNALRMLRETLAVMERHWPQVRSDPRLRDAWLEGRRTWQAFYGTHLVEEIRTHIHGHEWQPALVKVAALARLHPAALTTQAWRKLRASYARRAVSLDSNRPGH